MQEKRGKKMHIFEILLLAIGLGMDAFSVAICKGLTMTKFQLKKAGKIAMYFGVFQAIMPIFGYFLGRQFESLIVQIDHWIAFVLLGGIGLNLIREAWNGENEIENDQLDWKTLISLAIATSIDALAIGITFAFLQTNIWISSSIIGIIAFAMTFIGVKIGSVAGDRFNKRAKQMGGILLIGMGIKILIEHLWA